MNLMQPTSSAANTAGSPAPVPPAAVTVLCLNYNGEKVIGDCLQSLRQQTWPNVQVLVVDNASQDAGVWLIRRDFPEVTLLVNERNLGYGGGNNVGLAQVRTPYVLLLNNDTALDPQCIERMVLAAEADPAAGAVAAKILLKYDDLRIDAAGIEVCPDGLALGRGRWLPREALSEAAEVFFASGCCALCRMTMIESIKVNGEVVDEDFFAYADDTDMGWRARLQGWKTIYEPRAICYHHHSAATGSVHPRKVLWVERNRIWVGVKSFPLWLLAWGGIFMVGRYFWQTWGLVSGKGRAGEFRREYSAGRLAMVLLGAWWGALRGLPRMLAKRRIIRRGRKIGSGEILSLLRRFGMSARSVSLRN